MTDHSTPKDLPRAIEAVTTVLEEIGEDVNRDGLHETPGRVVRSWRELFSGYSEDPRRHLSTRFDVEHDQMVSLNGVDFFSTCEHHMLPFFGTVDVSYIPDSGGGVVGLSKLARVVHGYARRLQVQERLTDQIADAIEDELGPRGVAVRVRASHFCMVARGVRAQHSAQMVTTALRGFLREDEGARSEWLRGLPK